MHTNPGACTRFIAAGSAARGCSPFGRQAGYSIQPVFGVPVSGAVLSEHTATHDKVSSDLLNIIAPRIRVHHRQFSPPCIAVRSFHSSGANRSLASHENHPKELAPYPRCPTCSSEIRTNFNQTTKMEEKCKCPNCHSFIPTGVVITSNYGRDRLERRDEEGNDQDHRIDYFKLFGIEKKFKDLDLTKLKKSYHLWQQLVHPDFSGANKDLENHPSDLSIKYMKDWSVLVNRAKNTLSDELKRAEYLMKLHASVELSDESDSLDNTDLLMEILEVRERLEDAQTPGEIESIKKTNQQSVQEVLEGLDRKFQVLIHDSSHSGESESAKELVIKLRYLNKVAQIISSTDL
ncbi:hypothetical protein PCANC_05494 [Puccinia coronata f. sp. avenae]|uniref:J domain-containing protein n=1 Tax=Puccinia coronata f. sp. avenae TaxID=200324 RepID=A0A2N5T6K6_9BASI|nr:hypothetical protein PCANC_05494 [Puccinia coronata f. sp. avenae]